RARSSVRITQGAPLSLFAPPQAVDFATRPQRARIDVEVVEEGHARVFVDGLLLGLKYVMANIRLQRGSLQNYLHEVTLRATAGGLSVASSATLWRPLNSETKPIRFPILT